MLSSIHLSSALALPLLAAGTGEVVGKAIGIGFGLVVFLLLLKRFLYICRPNEILIVTGRKRTEGGVDLGPLIVLPHGREGQPASQGGAGRGRAFQWPLIERVDRMEVTTMSIDVVVNNAYSAGNIPLRIHAIANVRVHTDPKLVRNAVERFMGRGRNEIQQVAQQTLEGALREVLAQMTPEQVNEDRLTFAENLVKSAADDLDKLGLQLDTLKIQNVSDDTGYLDSLGRPAIAKALRDAENAENEALEQVTRAQANAKATSESAQAMAETAIVTKKNELARIEAELAGEAESVEREAVAAAQTARAEAERQLQTVRKTLEQKRLQAEVVLPAEARRDAQELLARGEAAPTVENGRAVVEVLDAMSHAWRSMGPHAREIYLIQHLEDILGAVIKQMGQIDIQEVNVLDSGDGQALARYAASYPSAVSQVLQALGEAMGLDIRKVLSGESPVATPPGTPPRPSGGPKGSPLSPPNLLR